MSLEMNLKIILERAIKDNASDVFIVAGLPVSFRTNGTINHVTEEKLFPQHTEALLNDIYELAGHRSMEHLHTLGDDDFSFAIQGLSRFRVSAYKQRGSLSAVIRIITFDLPDYTALGIPEHVMQLTDTSKGMILVTGPAGSGKSTTLACMINQINNTQKKHIITLEDPLEYLHQHKKSIVSQREIQIDTENYVSALRAALRKAGVVYSVKKNSMIGRACEGAGYGDLKQYLTGMTGIAISATDPVAAAKIMKEYADKVETFEIKAGFVDGETLDAAGVNALAEIPSKETLVARMLGSMMGPLNNFARCLQAIIDKQGEGEAEAAPAEA